MSEITYEHERTIQEDDPELSLLDVSLKHGIPHMHACGGNGRCSTCRVLIIDGKENLSPINDQERELALKRGFEGDVRLACQTTARGPVKLRRLVWDNRDYEEVRERNQSTTGREDNLAIMFSDIRSFTTFSEKHLPYDIIHILNRYFETMGEIVLAFGGMLDKYIGDGLMANFGLKQTDPQSICLRATAAALEMLKGLEEVNQYARQHLDHEFKIGIGLHYGDVIVGELGHHSNAAFTLIGDAVNTASRVESMTKKAGAQLLVSEDVYRHVKDHVKRGRVFRAPLKGKTGEFLLYEILDIDRSVVRQHMERGADLALREIKPVARDTYMIVFDKPAGFQFQPGQFVDLYIDPPPPKGELLPASKPESHSFSMASAPEETEIRFITRDTKSDYKKRLLAMLPGQMAHVSEATGHLIKRAEPKRQHVFLAGGIGVTPFYSIIRHEFDSSADSDLVLLYSNRDFDDVIYHEEFLNLDRDFTGFSYVPTLTKQIPDEWPAHFERGRVDEAMIQRHVDDLRRAVFYIGGSIAFVTAARDILEKCGVTPTNILQEEFYGY